MAEQDWTPSTIMLGHLQKLMKHGFMSTAELKACQVPKDHALPAPMEGHMVSFMAFHDQAFGVPSHPFLLSLLRYYGPVLHHRTPSGVLHINIFISLSEAYLGVDPDLNLWKYFFHVHRLQDPEAELMISRGVAIHVKLGHGVDPYLEIPMPRSMNGWRKRWFFLKNNDSTPLPRFSGGHPIPLTSLGEGTIRKDLSRIQTLGEDFQQLRWEGLTRIHPLWMFFNY
jgi:hypothetical protein